MAWEWSHTPEAYFAAYENVQNETREFLEVAFAEWHGNGGQYGSGNLSRFDISAHDKALERAKSLPADILADFIWQHAETQKTCDNGGFNAWVCPYGCHTVSFSCEVD